MRAKGFRTLVTAFFFFQIASRPYSTTWYVDQSASRTGDGRSPVRPLAGVQEAVDAAQDGDTVIIMPGNYVRGAHIEAKAIAVRPLNPADSSDVSTAVVIPWLGVYDVASGECRLEGLNIGGYSDSGGMFSYDSAVVLSHCAIYGNHPEKGESGVACRGGSLKMRACEVLANSGTPAVHHAGIVLRDCHAEISESVVRGNAAWETAGIHCENANATVTSCLIYGNTSYGGTGNIVVAGEGEVTLRNCVIQCNEGGAVIQASERTTIENCTLFGNSAGVSGTSETRITDCILWNRTNELTGCGTSYSCVQNGAAGIGNISSFPHFVNAGIGDFHLRSWSPCIDAGSPDSNYENEPLPNGGRVNMGAYGNTVEAISASDDSDHDQLPDDWEVYWFTNLDQVPEGDPDGNGKTNLEEYRRGGNPREEGTTLYVDAALGDDGRDGTTPTHTDGRVGPTASIMAAVGLAHAGDLIEVAPGEYYERVDFLGKTLHLRAAAGPGSATIDAYFSGPAIRVTWDEGPGTTLEGFRIVNGWSRFGAGILCQRGSLDVQQCAIMRNSAGCQPVWAESGGGAIACLDSEVSLIRCVLENNMSERYGAGIWCLRSGLVVSQCTIAGNDFDPRFSMAATGTIHFESSSALVTRCVISGNGAGGTSAHGVYAVDSSLTMTESLVARNGSGSRYAPAIGCKGRSDVRVANCTFFQNSTGGGAVAAFGAIPEIANCIFVGNGPSNVNPTFSCADWEAPGEGNIVVQDPLFVDPAANDFRLRPDSPCIDVGSLAAALCLQLSLTEQGAALSWQIGQDLDGNPRLSGAGVDMGAYEYQSAPPTFLIESSSDLMEWVQGGTTSGLVWLDDAAAAFGRQFYRLRLLP